MLNLLFRAIIGGSVIGIVLSSVIWIIIILIILHKEEK